jgi:hypothetical protein
MTRSMSTTPLAPDLADQLVSAARTALGDTLRAVVLFDVEDSTPLYFRGDIETDARVFEDAFVANERLGFTSQETYAAFADQPLTEPHLGEYRYTLRAFSDGYVARVIVGDHGLLVTTDTMHAGDFEEFATAVRHVIASA